MAAFLLVIPLVACGTTTGKSTTHLNSGPKPTPPPMITWGKPVASLTFPGENESYSINDMAYSSDSKSIAFTMQGDTSTKADSALKIWHIGTPSPIIAQIGSGIEGFAWSPKSNTIAVATEDKGIVMVNDQDGSITATIGDNTSAVRGVTWSPDGSQIAASVGQVAAAVEDNVQVYNAQSGAQQFSLPIDTPSTSGLGTYYSGELAWSSDNKYIAAATADPAVSLFGSAERGSVSIWNVATHKHIFQQKTESSTFMRIAFQPGTDILAQSGSDTSKQSGILLIDAATTQFVKTLTGNSLPPSWSPDGKYIARGGTQKDEDTVQVLSTSDWSTVYTYSPCPIPKAVAWAPDGHTIASAAGIGNEINVWQTQK